MCILYSPENQSADDQKISSSVAVVAVVVPPAMLMRRGLGVSERTE
jgi:hypothetical protein